jgi:CBS domain-containing protein
LKTSLGIVAVPVPLLFVLPPPPLPPRGISAADELAASFPRRVVVVVDVDDDTVLRVAVKVVEGDDLRVGVINASDEEEKMMVVATNNREAVYDLMMMAIEYWFDSKWIWIEMDWISNNAGVAFMKFSWGRRKRVQSQIEHLQTGNRVKGLEEDDVGDFVF